MLWLVAALTLASQDPAPPAPGASEPAAAGAPAQPAVAASEADRIICRMEDQVGSLFKTRTCLTRAEWKKRRDRDRGAAERVLDLDTKPGVQSQ